MFSSLIFITHEPAIFNTESITTKEQLSIRTRSRSPKSKSRLLSFDHDLHRQDAGRDWIGARNRSSSDYFVCLEALQQRVLIARRAEQLQLEKSAVAEAVGQHIRIKTYSLDVVNTKALLHALDDAEACFGKPECIFYNAARVLPSKLLDHDVETIEYDNKVRARETNPLYLLHIVLKILKKMIKTC